MYAYGDGIGGLPVFSAGGDAFIGNFSKFNDPNAAPVTFTPDNHIWQGTPNVTDSSSAPNWSNLTFSIPANGASNNSVGFVNSTSAPSDRLTDGFLTYGNVIFFAGASGKMQSQWYATPYTIDGIYALKWNASNDLSEDKIILALKKTVPSTSLFPATPKV
ncbi:hypothetical protein LZ31DRAFT_509435 [Colletotrichum somersetense]|nr:hypothetical protein LZ31DRAFT_509435 [Colletotrichum somersetense]